MKLGKHPRDEILTKLAIAGQVLGTVATILLSLKDFPLWPGILILIASSIALVANLYYGHNEKKRTAHAAREEEEARRTAEQNKWDRQVRHAMRLWEPPRVSDLRSVDAGVKCSATAVKCALDRDGTMPYITRGTLDELSRERLRQRGLVLLVGEPASGVTRTAYELARRATPNSVVLAPRPPNGLRESLTDLDVLSRLRPSISVLLWLDRIDLFSDGAITPDLLEKCLKHAPGSRIIATVPAGLTYEAWRSGNPGLLELFGDAVLVRRAASEDEIERAQKAYPGVDFSQGICPAFTSLTSLIHRVNQGFHDCPREPHGRSCDLAISLVALAIAWFATGTTLPLPLAYVPKLIDGDADDNVHLDAAVEWVTASTVEGAVLASVSVAEDGARMLTVSQQFAETHAASQRIRPNSRVWLSAIDHAADKDALDVLGRVGFTAHIEGEFEVSGAVWLSISNFSDDPIASWLSRSLEYSRQTNDLRGVIACLQHMIAAQIRVMGHDDVEVATTFSKLGSACSSAGDYQSAIRSYQRARAIHEKAYGNNHPEVAKSIASLGNSWRGLGDYRRAVELHQKALLILREPNSGDQNKVSEILCDLGADWLHLGDYKRALELNGQALAELEAAYGEDSIRLVKPLAILGDVIRQTGDYKEARKLHLRALRIAEREFGRGDSRITTALTSLAIDVGLLGDLIEARKLSQRALEIVESTWGGTHIQAAVPLSTLGGLWSDGRDYAKARGFHQRALDIVERFYGSEHVQVGAELLNLGIAYRGLGNYRKACDLHLRSLGIIEAAYGEDHIEVASTLYNLGLDHEFLGQRDKSRAYYVRALRLSRLDNRSDKAEMIIDRLRRIDPDTLY